MVGSVCLLAASSAPATAYVGPPETITNARKAIEGLPFEFAFSSPPRDTKKALIIRTTDKLGRSFRFFLFVGQAPLDIGLPSYHRENLSGGALGHSYVMLNNERQQIRPETITIPIHPIGGSGITAAQEHEFFEIEFAVEDTVCEVSTGNPCPAI